MKRYKDGLYITRGKSLIRICGGFGTVVFAHKKSNHKVGDNVYDPGLKYIIDRRLSNKTYYGKI
jgi:hypothetical protein